MRNLRCPLIKPRPGDGTFYTFGSALEDIGLNINTSDYKVELSHYVILDIPEFGNQAFSYLGYGMYNNPGDYKFANFFQCAVLNVETLLRAQDSYDFSTKETVSENLFWEVFNQFLGQNSLFDENTTYGNGEYYLASSDYIKGIGLISGGAQRTDSYGIYNETYIQIPSSYKQTPVYFKKERSKGYGQISIDEPYLYGIPKSEMSEYTIRKYISETGIDAYSNSTNVGKRVDGQYSFIPSHDAVKVEFSTDALASIYGKDSITYDEMATADNLPEEYKFNALLVYYSIYNANGDIIATNPYGLLILTSSEKVGDSNSGFYKFKELDKKASNSTTIGNSYAFRLNIKTSSTYATNITVSDNSTAGYSQTLDYNDMVRYLGDAVNILSSNSQLIAKLVSENQSLKEMLVQAIDKIDTLSETIDGQSGIKARLTALEKT